MYSRVDLVFELKKLTDKTVLQYSCVKWKIRARENGGHVLKWHFLSDFGRKILFQRPYLLENTPKISKMVLKITHYLYFFNFNFKNIFNLSCPPGILYFLLGCFVLTDIQKCFSFVYHLDGADSASKVIDGRLNILWVDQLPAWVMIDLLKETWVTKVILVGMIAIYIWKTYLP